jgi:hypothetical protein
MASRYATARCLALSTGSGLLLALQKSRAPFEEGKDRLGRDLRLEILAEDTRCAASVRGTRQLQRPASRCSATFWRIGSFAVRGLLGEVAEETIPPSIGLSRMSAAASSKILWMPPMGSNECRATARDVLFHAGRGAIEHCELGDSVGRVVVEQVGLLHPRRRGGPNPC